MAEAEKKSSAFSQNRPQKASVSMGCSQGLFDMSNHQRLLMRWMSRVSVSITNFSHSFSATTIKCSGCAQFLPTECAYAKVCMRSLLTAEVNLAILVRVSSMLT